MGDNLEKLLSLATESLSKENINKDLTDRFENYSLYQDLLDLLRCKNGFYLFESALYTRPFCTFEKQIGLLEWNSAELWINEYQTMAIDCLFFAEDVFGHQYCVRSDGIYFFDPEVGTLEFIAENFESWSRLILEEFDFYSGFQIAHEWQVLNGCLQPEMRLMPKIPFVLGSRYELSNLYSLDAVKSMKTRASLAMQIKGLPDGGTVTFKVED